MFDFITSTSVSWLINDINICDLLNVSRFLRYLFASCKLHHFFWEIKKIINMMWEVCISFGASVEVSSFRCIAISAIIYIAFIHRIIFQEFEKFTSPPAVDRTPEIRRPDLDDVQPDLKPFKSIGKNWNTFL